MFREFRGPSGPGWDYPIENDYDESEYERKVLEAEALDDAMRECGLILPEWEVALLEECVEESYLQHAPEENYRDFPGDERCFDWEAQDEMAREDAAGISYEQQ